MFRFEGVFRNSKRHYHHQSFFRGNSRLGVVVGGCIISYAAAAVVHRWSRGHEAKSTKRLNGRRTTGLYGWWHSLRESQRTIWCLIGMNVAVFGLWRIGGGNVRLSQFLQKYFLHSSHSHPFSLMGSTFSHMSATHLLFNMFALYNFGPMLHDRMGREQFLAFYSSAGIVSAGGSAWISSALCQWTARYRSIYSHNVSLGASGALFGVLGACSHEYPNLRLSLIFAPWIHLSIRDSVMAAMAIDAAGLAMQWRMFDHAAHLSGSLFGLLLYPTSQCLWRYCTASI